MRRIILPLLFGLAGVAVLVSLGVWQIQRLHWKEGVLARIEAQMSKAPVALPEAPDPVQDKYLAVHVDGQFMDGVIRVLSGQKTIGAGYELIVPFVTDTGRRVLIDRGFIPLEQELSAPGTGKVTISGNLLWPDERTSSTPENDIAANIWFARDVDQMAQALDTEPLLVVAREITPSDETVTLVPVDTSHIPNDHLNYAITWFSLALIWLVMTVYFIRRQLGQRKGKET